MKERIVAFIIAFLLIVGLCGCTGLGANSTFSIQFIDVGQGDSAIVECDGRYMLIDVGDKQAGNKVYQVLEEKQVRKLDILVISHLHADHIGGLREALLNVSSIGLTLSNTRSSSTAVFEKAEEVLNDNNAKIQVPSVGDKYKLGSAQVEVMDVASTEENDSLVILVTYGDTRFMFTGDIEYSGQNRLLEKCSGESGDDEFKVNVIKIPHHGSYGVNGTFNTDNSSYYRMIRTFNPDYAVISVGADNKYGHPHKETLDLLSQANVKVYRTDLDGDIIVKSDGESISIKTSK